MFNNAPSIQEKAEAFRGPFKYKAVGEWLLLPSLATPLSTGDAQGVWTPVTISDHGRHVSGTSELWMARRPIHDQAHVSETYYTTRSSNMSAYVRGPLPSQCLLGSRKRLRKSSSLRNVKAMKGYVCDFSQ